MELTFNLVNKEDGEWECVGGNYRWEILECSDLSRFGTKMYIFRGFNSNGTVVFKCPTRMTWYGVEKHIRNFEFDHIDVDPDVDPVDLPDGVIDDCPGLEPKNSWWCDACATYHPNADVNACPEFDKLPFN